MAAVPVDPVDVLEQGLDSYFQAFNLGPAGVPPDWGNHPAVLSFHNQVRTINLQNTLHGLANHIARWNRLRELDKRNEVVNYTVVQMFLDTFWETLEDLAATCGVSAFHKVPGNKFRYNVSAGAFTRKDGNVWKANWTAILDHHGYINWTDPTSRAERTQQCTLFRSVDGSFYMMNTIKKLYLVSEPDGRRDILNVLCEVCREHEDFHPGRLHITHWKILGEKYRQYGRAGCKTQAIEYVTKFRKKNEIGSQKRNHVDAEYIQWRDELKDFYANQMASGNFPSFQGNAYKFLTCCDNATTEFKFQI